VDNEHSLDKEFGMKELGQLMENKLEIKEEEE